MIYKLEMPYIDRSIEHGQVLTWHKAEGEFVDYGEDIVDLQVDVKKIGRTKSSLFLSRGLSSKTGESIEKGMIRLTSSDRGVLRQITTPAGAPVTIGHLMALLTPTEDEPVTDDIADAINFRVISNRMGD